MLIDLHFMLPGGRPGRLLETLDLDPFKRHGELWVKFQGEDYRVLTGVRAMIVVKRAEK